MVSIRKLSHLNAKFALSSLDLVLVNCSGRLIYRCPFRGDGNLKLINRVVGSSSTNISHQSNVVRFRHFFSQSLSTMSGTILVQAQDLGKMSEDLERAIDEPNFLYAWELLERHIQMDGLPRKSLVNRLLTSCAENLEVKWLEKAYALVEQIFEDDQINLLEKESLIYLSFALSKCRLPVPASTLLRKLVEAEMFPPVGAWSAIIGHMSQTPEGAYLAAELVLEIGYLFQDGRVDPRKKTNSPLIAMKPNITSFNLSLGGCVLFGTTRKAEQLLDMMPRINMKADTNLLIIMAHIYEQNGRLDELKKLKRHVDEAHDLTDTQVRQFYNCLLACHLNSGDLDSASQMVLEMIRKAKKAQNSLGVANLLFESSQRCNRSSNHKDDVSVGDLYSGNQDKERKKILSFQDFCRDRKFFKLQAEAEELLDNLLAKLKHQIELITSKHGILQPTETIYVKLVKAFLEAGRAQDLVYFLTKVEKEDSPVSVDDSVLVQSINSCISLGWLDLAHDLLDEMRLAGVKTGSSVYSSLLKAYCKEKRTGEVASLLRDARRAGVQLDASCYDILIQSQLLHKDTQSALHLFKEMKEAKIPRSGHKGFQPIDGNGEEAGLMPKLLQEIKEGQKVDYGVHEWNSVIHFFCKKHLMTDAEKAFKKMRSLGHSPNAQTFHSLVTGYAAVGGQYTEVADLWGQMKSIASCGGMKFDEELLDGVLYTFVRGGFFTRANEVVKIIENGKMFVDKYKYRALFLKYHRTLHKGKDPKVQTEALLKKREAALAFKRWVGLH
ncbi:unnamed protein product [Cuscuta campestris]|uniref:At1g68980-like TPR repeats domain-containing protein n=1 Tax=Cuscuta campestris TaxID=132261 RepID=A0A484LFF5_9ASTE|nr:unnamed protein product [Cuscuta campestris]